MKLIYILSLLMNIAFAAESTVPVIGKATKVINASDQISTVNTNNLSTIDSSAENAIELKRQYEIAKQKAEIRKLQGNSNASNLSVVMPQDNAQTTVTGVAINQDGRKIAWLQFADGGALTVDIGSKVGNFIVSNISMTGVTLSGITNKPQKVFLKRVYSANEEGKKQANKVVGPFPSPITTLSNDDVPPIVNQ